MALFQKIADSFSVNKSTRSDEDRDQVIRETKKRTRLIKDGDWIKSKPSDESQHMATDVNYGKSALGRAKSSEGLNSDSSKMSGLKSTTKADTIDGRKRDTSSTTDLSKTHWASTLDRPTSDKGSTDISSPTNKYSSLERKTRTSSYKTEELPKMTIITSETKTESPISKSQQSRTSPDGRVTTQEKSPTKPILKWSSQKEETSRSSYVPKSSTLEQNTSKSDFISKVGSKSLIDLSITPEQTNTKSPVTTPTAPARTSSLIDLSPSSPAKPKRNSGEWDNTSFSTTTSTKTSFDPNSRKSRNSGNWDESSSYTTTSTKSTFNPRTPSGDWDEVTSYTTTSTKTTFNPRNSSSEDWDNTNSHTTTSTKTTFDPSSSSNSLNDKSPVVELERYDSRSSYKENSPPSEHLSEDGDSYRSPSYSKIRNSSSSLSDGKSPAKVISLTTAFTSAEQRSSDKNKCSQCYKPIEHGAKMILEELNINCHAACFKCQICHTSLENLSAGDNFWVHQRVVHCENCYDKVKAQRSY
ncbi:sciellin isoform X4 [Rhincodon typus]|uniref:sciellin isoform X4 n=1 Tax=Rhincodon typus TaxID=259920 RepID=UPI00202DFD2F|nr:sciellin isoform X4 [Rhincodon typus]